MCVPYGVDPLCLNVYLVKFYVDILSIVDISCLYLGSEILCACVSCCFTMCLKW